MKKFPSSLVVLLLTIFSMGLGMVTSSASSISTVILYSAPHQDLMGKSLDSGLSQSLSPEGRIGRPVFSPPPEPRRWFIDAALIEDIMALTPTSTVAQEWIARLKIISAGDEYFAIPFGHPDLSTARKLSPSELNYYYEVSKSKLALALSRDVSIDRNLRWSSKQALIPQEVKDSYLQNLQNLTLLATVISPTEIDPLRAKLAFLLATDTTANRRSLLRISADDAVAVQNHKLRIVAGKFRLTSEHEKVPITLVNDFDGEATLQLQLTPLNSRIHVNSIENIKLLPRSKIQLSVPFTVIASGSTAVLAQFANAKGVPISDSVLLALSLSVISPAVAWFTTGAAILLFLAALTQSVRRVRRSRK